MCRWDITGILHIMKNLIILLFALFAFTWNAKAQNTCNIYGTNEAKATLVTKGDQTNNQGNLSVRVYVGNYKENSYEGDRYVTVWVEIRDRVLGCVARRVPVQAKIPKHNYSGEGNAWVEGLEPNTDYLFNIDSAVSCK